VTLSPEQRADCIAALRWQLEMGATDAVAGHPVNRLQGSRKGGVSAAPPRSETAERPVFPAAERPASHADGLRLMKAATSLEALHEAIRAFEGCPLKAGATNTVIADGNPAARVMIVGEAPGADEDRLGYPFVGPSGKLLDKAMGAIGLSRMSKRPGDSFYITNIVFWRPPGNRNPTPREIGQLLPFTERHIQLAKPDVLFLLGNIACQSLLRTGTGIIKLRGNWMTWRSTDGSLSLPALPSFHPSFLLRVPTAKKPFWADLQELQRHLKETGSAES